jgi:hypothetical protein
MDMRRPRLYGMAKNRGIEMGWRTWLLWVSGKTVRYQHRTSVYP